VFFAEKLTAEMLAPVPPCSWTFSIPRVLRRIVERDRKLLGLPSRTAWVSILKTFQALLDRTDVRAPARRPSGRGLPELSLDFGPWPSPFPLCPRIETLIR
jgi:hypothetical protein